MSTMNRIQAKELGFEHLGKMVTALSVTPQSFQLIAVTHRVPLSEWATRDNPTPDMALEKSYVTVVFNGVMPLDLEPDSMVMINE